METDAYNPAEQGSQVAAPPPTALTPLDIIRTETVLSKLPVHNLSKKGRVNIQILKTTPDGQVELKWEVSYNERYGQARQLAYKLDTIVINQKIDQAGRPLPPRLRLGSLREVCKDLGISDDGREQGVLKRAFMQNAGALITAKFKYKTNDGGERTLEAGFTRYSVIFTGQKFPDGTKADAVYITFNPDYREVLNNAPMRPLNLEYMKQLPPAPQRFYEIISYKIFAAIKNNLPVARLPYSEYCTFSAQQRYFVREQFRKQMFKIHEPHKKSGYIASVHYDDITDTQGQPDWIMNYVPGPKAKAEYATFTGKKPKTIDAAAISLTTGAGESTASARPRQRRLKLQSPDPANPEPALVIDYRIVAELGRRGIGESDARQLLAVLQPGQPILDQLEWGDYQIAHSRSKIDNPPGFYISLLKRNVPLPSTFESSAARKRRQEAELAQAEAFQKRQAERETAEEAERQKLNDQITALPESARLALQKQAKATVIAEHPNLAGYFKTNPQAETEDGAIRSRMRIMLKSGWIAPAQAPAVATEQESVAEQSQTANPLENLQAILTTPQLPQRVEPKGNVSPQPQKVDDHLL